MSEQETKKKKKEVGGYNPLFREESFIERLEELYNIYQNYEAVARTLMTEFDTDITGVHVKNLYNQRMAKVVTHNKGASEFFEDSFQKMKTRWEDAWEMVGDLIYQYRKMKDTTKDNDDAEKAIFYMKMTPTIIQITQEIRKQLEFIQSQQEQIKVNQTNLVYSPIQINQHLHKVFKNWVDEGYVKILKTMPGFDKEEDENEEKDEESK